jgi:hypothetical protein
MSNSEQIPYEVSLLYFIVFILNNMTYIQNTHCFRGFKLAFANWLKFSLIEDMKLMSDFKKNF